MAHDIIVIGASAGGVEALSRIAADLPADLPAAVFVVVHFPASATSVLPRILSRAGPLPASQAENGEPIRPGRIYVAPPGQHLVLARGHVHTTRGPRENGHRPAVDPLFRSAADAYGSRVVGVVLSGNLDDGTDGLQVIRSRGGAALVQDPLEAMYPGMPLNAMDRVEGAQPLSLAEIGPTLARMASAGTGSPNRDAEGARVMVDPTSPPDLDRPDPDELGSVRGNSSGLSCPECAGSLWEEHEEKEGGREVRYRCRVGHAYSAESLFSEKSEAVEAVLWSALNALEEKADLARRMARRLGGGSSSTRRFREQAEEATEQARILRALLLGGGDLPAPPDAPPEAEKRSA